MENMGARRKVDPGAGGREKVWAQREMLPLEVLSSLLRRFYKRRPGGDTFKLSQKLKIALQCGTVLYPSGFSFMQDVQGELKVWPEGLVVTLKAIMLEVPLLIITLKLLLCTVLRLGGRWIFESLMHLMKRRTMSNICTHLKNAVTPCTAVTR